jgi:hypothetical protein
LKEQLHVGDEMDEVKKVLEMGCIEMNCEDYINGGLP